MGYTLSQLTLDLACPTPLYLPQGTLITCALEEHARADAEAITLARHTVQCGGTLPASLILQYDLRTVGPRGSLSIQVSITCEGNLLLINDEEVPVVRPDIDLSHLGVSEGLDMAPITVPLALVDARISQAHQGGHVIEGIHGGNLVEGIHGGNLIEGIHGGNRMQEPER